MKRPNLYDRLKVLAILTMIIDHLGYTIFPEISWLRLVGRIAFPIFLFLVGFNGNYKRRRDLFVRAVIVQIPIFVASVGYGFGGGALNILFGIIVGRVVVQSVNGVNLVNGVNGANGKPSLLSFTKFTIVVIVLLVVHPRLKNWLDYGSFVILFPLMGWLVKQVNLVNGVNGANRKPSLLSFTYFTILLYSVLVFAFLFGFTQMIFGFSLIQLCILGGFFILLLCIFFFLGQGNRFLPLGKSIDTVALFISKNALLIYVFHLLALRTIKIFLLGGGGL